MTTAAVNIIFHHQNHNHHPPLSHHHSQPPGQHFLTCARPSVFTCLPNNNIIHYWPAGTRPQRTPFLSDLELSVFQRPARQPQAKRTPLECTMGINTIHNNQTGAGERWISSTIDKLEDDKEVTDQRGGEGRRGSGGRGKRRRRRRSRKIERCRKRCKREKVSEPKGRDDI